MQGQLAPAGGLGLAIIRGDAKARIDAALRRYRPGSDLGKTVVEAIRFLPQELALELLDRVQSSLIVESALSIKVFRNHGLWLVGRIPRAEVVVEDYDVVGRRVITTAGVNWLASAFDNTVEAENQKYHGIGTGTTAEATTDTALVTELTTEYNPDNTRATGVNAHSTNTATSTATNTIDSGTPSITEHGLFDNATRGSGTLFDRTKFTAIALVGANGDGIQSVYTLTLTAGG